MRVPDHRDYSHRDVLDKLGIRPDTRLAIDQGAGPLDPNLRERLESRGIDAGDSRVDPVDLVLLVANIGTDICAGLRFWRDRIVPSGGIWVLTPKRGRPGYVSQDRLIPLGPEARLVDNKICSVSDATSAMRFVIRRADRPR
jgi:hypothetical protein